MELDAVIVGSACGDSNCGLVRVLGSVPGVARSVRWADWDPQSTAEAGVFVLIGARECGAEGKDLVAWFKLYARASWSRLALRRWPIVVVSPHADKWLRELSRAMGVDLRLEACVLFADVPHGSGAGGLLCEDEVVQREAKGVVTQVTFQAPWKRYGDARSLAGELNVRHAVTVMRSEGMRLHADLHEARSGRDRGVGPNVEDRLAAVGDTLRLFVTPAVVDDFLRRGENRIGRLRTSGEQKSAAADYLEQSAAALSCAGARIRRRNGPRLVALIVDDDARVAGSVRDRLGRDRDVMALDVALPLEEMHQRVAEVERCGGDPSLAAAEPAWKVVGGTLEQLQARERWAADCTQFVLIADIRFGPRAPEAGLWVIRRSRDAYPFLLTIALTVRRGLADELADEAVDAYLVKESNVEVTAEHVASAVNELTAARGNYSVLSGVEDLLEDENLTELITRKYRLRRVSPDATGEVRLAIAPADRLREAMHIASPGGVVALVLAADQAPGQVLKTMRAARDESAVRVAVFRRVVGKPPGLRVLPSSCVKLDRIMHSGRMAKHHLRWSLLVPKTASWGGINVLVGDADVGRLRTLVAERFGGATAGDAHGLWLRPTDRIVVSDELEALEVWTRKTEAAREFMFDVAGRVIRALGQEEVYVLEEGIVTWSLMPESPLAVSGLVDETGRITVSLACDAVFGA